MKRILTIFAALTVLAGAISGAILQSTCVAIIGMAATANPIVGFVAGAVTFIYICLTPESPNGYAGVAFTQGICEKVQTSLTQLLGNNAPSLKRTKVGYLEALMSPQNTAGIEQVPIDPGNGKIKQVLVKYITRGTSNELTTTEPNVCNDGQTISPKDATVSITNQFWSKVYTFEENEMRKLCEDDGQYMAAVINSRLDTFMVELNKKLITSQSTNFGNFYASNNSVKSVALLKSNNDAHHYGETVIADDFENLEVQGRPILIGGGKLGTYTRQANIGCCNDGGQNMAAAANFDFFRDKYVGGILGNADDFIGLIPGYLQFLTVNRYVGKYVKENDVFSHGTMVDPYTGLSLDMKWHYNDCTDSYNMYFGLRYEPWYMPSDAFQYGDELYGFNGSLHYRATALS